METGTIALKSREYSFSTQDELENITDETYKRSLTSIIKGQRTTKTEYKIISKACVIKDDDCDFIVPCRSKSDRYEVGVNMLSQLPLKFFNRSLLKKTDRKEIKSDAHSRVLIRVGNIFFIDAALYIILADRAVYKLEATEGPFYLKVPYDQMRQIQKQLKMRQIQKQLKIN